MAKPLPNKLQEYLQKQSVCRLDFVLRTEKEDVNRDDRLVRLSFSSDNPIDHGGVFLILGHSKDEGDVSRLNDGGAFLDMHKWDRQIGAFIPGTVKFEQRAREDGKKFTVGVGTVKVSRNAIGEEFLNDAEDGIRSKVSVGFYIKNAKLIEENEETGDTYRITAWEALEASSVSVPADTSVGVGRSQDNTPEPIKVPVEVVVNAQRSERSSVMEKTPEQLKKDQDEIRLTAKSLLKGMKVEEQKDELNEIAMDAIQNGASVDEFKARCLEARVKHEGAAPTTGQEPGIGMKDHEVKRYSLAKAILEASENRLSGLEKEVSDETEKRTGKKAKGFMMPHDIMRASIGADARGLLSGLDPVKREMVAGVLASGGYLIDTKMMSMIELLRNTPKCAQMGITFLTGLVGNLAFPKQTGSTTTYWLPEGGSVGKTTPSFGQLVMKPKRMASAVDYTKDLLMQSSIDVEAFIRMDIALSQALSIDSKILSGTGGDNEPIGILKAPGVTTTAIGAAGGVNTFAKCVAQETAVAVANADEDGMGYLTTPGVRGQLKTTAEFTNTGIRVWQNNPTERNAGIVNGYVARATNQMPSDGSKGGASSLHAQIFGAWRQYIFGLWDGVDVVVDPYTGKLTGTVGVVITQHGDGILRQPTAFDKIVDIVVS